MYKNRRENNKILTKVFSQTILRLGLCTSVVAIASCGNNIFNHDSRNENLKGGDWNDVTTAMTNLQTILTNSGNADLGKLNDLSQMENSLEDLKRFGDDLNTDLSKFNGDEEICKAIQNLQAKINDYVNNVKAQDPKEGDENIKSEHQKIVLSGKDIKGKKDDKNQQIVCYWGDSETVLYRRSLQNPEEMTILQIPDNITKIEDECFSYQKGFSEVKFPDSIEGIGENCFCNTSLSNVILPVNLKKIGSKAFSGTALKTITIPEKITKLEEQTFDSCRQLKSITIYSTLGEICDNAFQYCENLQDVIVADLHKGDTFNCLVPYFIKKILKEKHDINCPNFYIDAEDVARGIIKIEDGICYIPNGAKKIGKYCFWWHKEIKDVKFPDSIEKIDNRAFCCTNLESIVIPENVKIIGNWAFSGTKLESIVIPENVTIIGDNCFYDCECLREIILSANLEKIGGRAFLKTNLQSVILPPNITKYECLVPLFIKEILKKQGIECPKCFADTEDINRGIIKIDEYGHCSIPGGVTEVGNQCFKNCEKLKFVDLPESLTKIGDQSFANSSLIGIILPPKLTQIGYQCFINCKNLKMVTWSFALTEIGSGAFSNTGIESIIIPQGIKVIRRGCFLNCQYLTSVIIYSPTIEIERDAFLFTKGVNIYLKKSTFEKLNGKNNLPEKRQFFFM